VNKPSHLGPRYAAQFRDAAIVEAYRHRPPYPPGTFAQLVGLLPGACRTVLDLGCGTGDLTVGLAQTADRIDAVDASEAMLAEARRRLADHGDRVRIVLGPAETAPLSPPYGLVTAGESLHWMAWRTVFDRIREALHPGGRIAIVERLEHKSPWTGDLTAHVGAYSTNRAFRPYDLMALLAQARVFVPDRVIDVPAVGVRQTVADYVESIHSRNGFSRERMGDGPASAFDARVTGLLSPFADPDGRLAFAVGARIWAGR